MPRESMSDDRKPIDSRMPHIHRRDDRTNMGIDEGSGFPYPGAKNGGL